MDESQVRQQLEALGADGRTAIAAARSDKDLEAVEVSLLGKKGRLTGILRSLSGLPKDVRPVVGAAANQLKSELMDVMEARRREVEEEVLRHALEDDDFDITVPPPHTEMGHIHPLIATQYRVEDIFTALGFAVMDGPEVETDYYNFEALNIPEHHPARDIQDTFWLDDGNLLRTHTSPVQLRTMERMPPPIRVICPGRVFRNEAVDATHENTFYQVEGLVVDEGISIAHLISIMKTFLHEVFGREVVVRLRPGYFPFVEPGFELDIECVFCDRKGCGICKRTGWIEFLGCGLIHPRVLRFGNVDPERYSGFAFGMGLNRLAMLLHGVDDIRHFQAGDLRFLRQF